MGVLSKLVNAMVPRTISGIIFWVIPIAAAVMVVVYPHAVAKLFVREDPERLLDELTASEGKKKKRPTKGKTASTGNGMKRGGATSVISNVADVGKEEPVETDAPISEEEQLLELANLQGLAVSSKKRPQKSSPPPAKVTITSQLPAPVPEVLSPTLTNIPSTTSKLKDDQEGWSRVPTKEEETVALLKNKLATALRQYEEAALDAETTRQLLEKESKKASEAEREAKDRTRSYQLRWVEMETELANLRSGKNTLQEKITELLQNAAQSEQQQKMISELQGRLVVFEAEASEIPSLQQLLSEAEKESADRFAELQSLQDILTEERQALLTERKAKKDLVDRLEASADEIAALMQKLTQEAQERQFLAAKLETSERKVSAKETELQSARSEISLLERRQASLNDQIDSLKVELESVLASKATHDEAAINELVAAKKSLQEQVSESLATIDSLTHQLSQKTADNEDLNKAKQLNELNELTAREEKNATEKLVADITEKHNMLQAEQEGLMIEVNELKGQLEAAEKRAADALDTAAIMEKKLTISNKVADARYTAYQKEIEDLKATVASSVTVISA